MTIKNDLQMVISVPDREQQEAMMLTSESETPAISAAAAFVYAVRLSPGVLQRMPVLERGAL